MCVYIRSLDIQGNPTIHLLCSKTRVAPLKSQTILRLELCAVLLMARLVRRIIEAFDITLNRIVH